MAEFSTNPGDRSVTELEREVDRERERVSATIDELQARASVGSLVDQVVKAVGENGGEVSRNLGRSLRDNPLAALLTGVGLAWLMAGSGPRRDEANRWEDQERDFLRPRQDRLSETPAASSYGSSPERSWQEPGYPDDPGEAPRWPPRARHRRCWQGRRGHLRYGRGVRDRASDVAHSASARLHQAGDHLREAGGAVRHRRRCRTSQRGWDDGSHAPRPRHPDRGATPCRGGNRHGPRGRRRRRSATFGGRGSDLRGAERSCDGKRAQPRHGAGSQGASHGQRCGRRGAEHCRRSLGGSRSEAAIRGRDRRRRREQGPRSGESAAGGKRLAAPDSDQGDSHTDETKHHTYVRPAGRKKMDIPPATWSKTDEEVDESFPASDPPGNY